jgi:hypothetical protein
VVIAGNEAVRLAERASVTEIESLNGISGEVVTALDSIKRAIQDVSEYVDSAETYDPRSAPAGIRHHGQATRSKAGTAPASVEGRDERTRRARKPGRNLL